MLFKNMRMSRIIVFGKNGPLSSMIYCRIHDKDDFFVP